MVKAFLLLFITWALTACQNPDVAKQRLLKPDQQNFQAAHQLSTQLPTQLPKAVANNAVAYLQVDGQDQFYSFNGLLAGKTHQDITNQAWVWRHGEWQALSVPSAQPRVLAATAVSAAGAVYLMGGYTVAADHSEKSVPNVWRIDAVTDQWLALPPMPTPVDDTVALVYQDRFIYLISGWHDVANVELVQVFDTQSQTWQQATPLPLPPVFGHAGGIVDNKILVCDGVKLVVAGEQRNFLPSPACAVGTIDANDHHLIDWQVIEHHSGVAHYRMAASSHKKSQIHFFGGSNNPYNYDGIGYNGQPSKASNVLRIYDFNQQQWTLSDSDFAASMDHRAALSTWYGLVIMGGMKDPQQVTNEIKYLK
ncbi:hypothetical protein OS175_12060 [Marinicella sp. S1101]|uniref:Kelch repeat-containing protein n=1 Tax=Marinicella marina TaxID=2996016 RepID=UPI002260944C|nr:hypothetical protein [Marinicella marina]MCX7554618.1 hypothetical protein [Marinicella marina]MDJ1140683.1 hypothetical protein [Marinicella marina]